MVDSILGITPITVMATDPGTGMAIMLDYTMQDMAIKMFPAADSTMDPVAPVVPASIIRVITGTEGALPFRREEQ
jgi:hypothetical protein